MTEALDRLFEAIESEGAELVDPPPDPIETLFKVIEGEGVEIVDKSPLIQAMLHGAYFKALSSGQKQTLFLQHIDYALEKRAEAEAKGEEPKPFVKNVSVEPADFEGWETKSDEDKSALLDQHIDWAMLSLGEWTEDQPKGREYKA